MKPHEITLTRLMLLRQQAQQARWQVTRQLALGFLGWLGEKSNDIARRLAKVQTRPCFDGPCADG